MRSHVDCSLRHREIQWRRFLPISYWTRRLSGYTANNAPSSFPSPRHSTQSSRIANIRDLLLFIPELFSLLLWKLSDSRVNILSSIIIKFCAYSQHFHHNSIPVLDIVSISRTILHKLYVNFFISPFPRTYTLTVQWWLQYLEALLLATVYWK